MKALLIVMIVAVLVALASAGVFMLRRRDGDTTPEARDRRMARALAFRVALSVALFLLILLGWFMGWVKPSGIPVGV